jgi:hypothetical protein
MVKDINCIYKKNRKFFLFLGVVNKELMKERFPINSKLIGYGTIKNVNQQNIDVIFLEILFETNKS